MPWDVWCLVLAHGGPLALLPASHRPLAAALRLQRAARGYLARVPALEDERPREVRVRHGGAWKRGTLSRVCGGAGEEDSPWWTVHLHAPYGKKRVYLRTSRCWRIVMA